VEDGIDTQPQALLFGRHFLVLLGLAAVLAAIVTRRPWGTQLCFALYGALHALAVAVSLRPPRPLPSTLRFIVIASILSVSSVVLGLLGSRFLGLLPALVGPPLLLTLCAAFGAASYCALIKSFWLIDLSLRAIGIIALGCVAATWISLRSDVLPKSADGLWLALPWWFAFSAGLYCNVLALRGKIPPHGCS
jgi:hypothetical protein